MAKTTHRRSRSIASIFAIALFAGSAPDLVAQNTLTESDKKMILERLEKLATTHREAKFARYAGAVAAFHEASQTPAKAYGFYLDCIKLVNFDQQGKKFSEYREWKERNIQRVRATEYQTMLQFQLKYLLLTIRALNMEDRSKIFPDLQTFLNAAVAKREYMKQEASGLNGSVSGTIFAKAYGLDKVLKDDRWEFAPLDIMGHYQKTILPILRERGDSKGIEHGWNRLINLEIAIMEPEEDEKVKFDFVKERLPTLHWSKWKDVAENGERAKAAMRMLELLENNLNHDDVEDWIYDLINVVNGGMVTDADFEPAPETEAAPDTEPAPETASEPATVSESEALPEIAPDAPAGATE